MTSDSDHQPGGVSEVGKEKVKKVVPVIQYAFLFIVFSVGSTGRFLWFLSRILMIYIAGGSSMENYRLGSFWSPVD